MESRMKGLYFIWFLDKEKQTSRRESKRKKKKKSKQWTG
jgi:hypothetical protein